MALQLITAPTAEPFTLTEVKEHLRLPLSYTTEDNTLIWCIKAARAAAEARTNRVIMPSTWKLTLDKFPSVIRVNKCPLISVTSLKYYNASNVLTTLTANTHYWVDSVSEPFRIIPVNSFPSVYDRPGAVELTFTAGYSTDATIPIMIKHGMLLTIADMYRHRETIVIGRLVSELSKNAEWAFDQERLVDGYSGNYQSL
jgi:uncharacterized phiE125 gp8 family phage protein